MGYGGKYVLKHILIDKDKIANSDKESVKQYLIEVENDLVFLATECNDLDIRLKAASAHNLALRDEIKAIQEAKINGSVIERFWRVLTFIAAFFGSAIMFGIKWIFNKKEE